WVHDALGPSGKVSVPWGDGYEAPPSVSRTYSILPQRGRHDGTARGREFTAGRDPESSRTALRISAPNGPRPPHPDQCGHTASAGEERRSRVGRDQRAEPGSTSGFLRPAAHNCSGASAIDWSRRGI